MNLKIVWCLLDLARNDILKLPFRENEWKISKIVSGVMRNLHMNGKVKKVSLAFKREI